MSAAALWHRDRWAAAVWDSGLKPLQKLIALAYADHARDGDTAWITYPRLMERTGLSHGAVARHLLAVVDAGWLTEVAPARQHRATVYRLTIPAQQSIAAEPAVHRSGASSPYDGHNLTTNLTTNHRKTSVNAHASTAPPLPVDWQPNPQNRALLRDHHLTERDVLADFRAQMAGERRRNWQRTFRAYVNAYADGRHEVTFPVPDDDEAPR